MKGVRCVAVYVAWLSVWLPKICLAVLADDSGKADSPAKLINEVVRDSISLIFLVILAASLVVLPIGIFLTVRNKKKDIKKYKLGISLITISSPAIIMVALSILALFGLSL